MPDYKRKKVHNKMSRKTANYKSDKISKKVSKQDRNFGDIKMSPEIESKSSIKVVKGRKLERQRKLKVLLSFAAVLLVAYILFSLLLPVSLSENIGNLLKSLGNGEYPIEIYGTEVIDSSSSPLNYYILTDTNLSAFARSGKEIYSYSHGYENPVLKTSETRALIFEQGGNSLKVYNLSKLIKEYSPKNEIINADIARNGSYAVAMHSDSYASSVKVFNKKAKEIFKWNSAKDTVNSVALSPSGKLLAVSTFNASGGILNSKVSIFDITKNSADPISGAEFTGKMVYALYSGKKGVSAVTEQGITQIKWKKGTKTETGSERYVDKIRTSNSGIVAVFNLNSNKSDNVITVISKTGEKVSEFNFGGIISDIRFKYNHIYCISESRIYLFDKKGNLLGEEECGFDAVNLAVLGSQSAAVISDTKIEKIKF